MKGKLILLAIVIVTLHCISVHAQVRTEANFSPNKFELGVGSGWTKLYSDLNNNPYSPTYDLKLVKNLTPFFRWDLEWQYGILSSSEHPNHWTNGIEQKNNYTSFQYCLKVGIGQFVKLPKNKTNVILNALYMGTGFGFIHSTQAKIDTKLKPTDPEQIPSYEWKKSDNTVFIPVNIGINIPINHLFIFPGALLNINYSMNYTFSDYVNGYKFTDYNAKNQYNDQFVVFNVSLLFNIGHYDDNTYFW